MANNERKKKKCKVVTTLICDAENGIDNGGDDILKMSDVAVNSKKNLEILKNFFKKQLGDKYEEDDTI